jgi:hypothetical protein
MAAFSTELKNVPVPLSKPPTAYAYPPAAAAKKYVLGLTIEDSGIQALSEPSPKTSDLSTDCGVEGPILAPPNT